MSMSGISGSGALYCMCLSEITKLACSEAHKSE